MYAALHFPDLALHCLLRTEAISPSLPIALISTQDREKSHLIALNHTARAHGLTHGMSSLSAMAHCPELYFLQPDPAAEKRATAELLIFAESLTPDFEATSPDTIVLDLSTIVLSTPEDWIQTTREKSSHLRLPLHIATAPTPDLAHLRALSPHADIHHLPVAELTRTHTFPILPTHVEILKLWGIHTLEELAALPRQGLSERLGPLLTWLHDVVHGKKHRLLTLHRPPTDHSASHGFETPIEHFEPILFIARRLLHTLCNRLRNIQRATSSLHLTLCYEDESTHRHTLNLTETTLDPEILLRSLHTHLDSIRASAPITSFTLRLLPALPAHKQHEIFQRGLRDPHRFADTLRQLSALVGGDHLGIPRIVDSHRPDSFLMHPVTPDFSLPSSPPISPTCNLPMSRFRPPVSIGVMMEKRGHIHHPLAILTGPHRGTILKASGPYPVSGNWWDRTWQQTQWDIELPQNRLLRITHNSGEKWELTGIYGA